MLISKEILCFLDSGTQEVVNWKGYGLYLGVRSRNKVTKKVIDVKVDVILSLGRILEV